MIRAVRRRYERKRRSFICGERLDPSRDDSFSKSSCISRVFLSRNSVAVIALPHGTNHQPEMQFGALNGAISIENSANQAVPEGPRPITISDRAGLLLSFPLRLQSFNRL